MMQSIILLILIYVFFIYIKQSDTEVAMVRSSIDGKEYLVQNKPDKQEAANALASIKLDLSKFMQYLQQNKDKHKSIELLLSRVDLDKISEGNEDTNYTTYTLNKGEKVVFCLRTRDHSDHIHKHNLLMFVAIHEMAHIMSVSEGHTEEFNKNFAFLCEEAVKAGVYMPEDYRSNPVNYCGIDVTDTPLGSSHFG